MTQRLSNTYNTWWVTWFILPFSSCSEHTHFHKHLGKYGNVLFEFSTLSFIVIIFYVPCGTIPREKCLVCENTWISMTFKLMLILNKEETKVNCGVNSTPYLLHKSSSRGSKGWIWYCILLENDTSLTYCNLTNIQLQHRLLRCKKTVSAF